MKINKIIVVLLVSLLAVVSCQTGAATSDANVEEGTTEDAAASDSLLKITVLTAGEIGDKGFVDSAVDGLNRIGEDFDNVETLVLQAGGDPNRYLDLFISAAEESDVIFVCPGYQFYDQLMEVAPQFPEKDFVFIDAESGIEGVSSIVYRENEGSFLAGALAAILTTRTDDLQYVDDELVIGELGGQDMPVIHNFMVGFEQGAKYINPDVEILSKFSGSHEDPAKCLESASAMYDAGADIIFQIAGGCGIGVFEAAEGAQKYTIGVDEDQKALSPDFTLASMRKRIGDSLYRFMELYINGEVNRGETYYYGLAENGVGLDYGSVEPDLVPQDVKDQIEELKQMIIDGEIVVDSYRE